MHIVGIDIGGTYTDLVSYDQSTEELSIEKVSSTPEDQSLGLIHGLTNLEINPEKITRLVHGTTVATNAVIERKGANCGLITTAGFRDTLDLGRRNRPNLWGLTGTYDPLIPRHQCYGVDERTLEDGTIRKRVSESDIREAGRELLEKGVEAIAVCFLHSYANPENEKAAIEILKEFWPNEYIARSSAVLPEFREFERASTTALTAYTQPVMSEYLGNLEEQLKELDYRDDILIMQSNGGLASASVSKRRSSHTILSGPAAGVTAATHIAQESGYDNVISCDMGGTSFDVSLIPGGEPITSQETELDFQIPIRVPMTDITAIGAGGGSIASVDEGNILETGPESAGADPGPVCYGNGGTDVTITDANLVLNRIDSEKPIGDDLVLDLTSAREAIKTDIAEPLGLSVERAASAVIDVGVNKMVGKMRELSIDEGYDPREFALVVYGGAGPLHGGDLIEQSNFNQVIIPYIPGVLSAFGCILANHRHDHVKTINKTIENTSIDDLYDLLEELEKKGKVLLSNDDDYQYISQTYRANMRYKGQAHTISVPLPETTSTKQDLEERFGQHYLEKFSEENDNPITIDNIKVTVTGITEEFSMDSLITSGERNMDSAYHGTREVFFDESWHMTDIYDRQRIPFGATITGPAIIEQDDATTVVTPDLQCTVDENANLILEV